MTLRLLALACLLALSACQSRPPVAEPAFAGRYSNACLPEAIAMVEGLREYQLPARVLIYEHAGYSHAIAVYQYQGKRWGWDSYWKSNRLRVPDLTEPDKCARAWLWATRKHGPLAAARFVE